MRKRYLLLILIIIVALGYRYRSFLPSFYNQYFTKYEDILPKGKEFVVRAEKATMNRYLQEIIKMSFPEYKLVFSQSKKPNLVVRSKYRVRSMTIPEEIKSKVPYIAVSAEKSPMQPRRYRASGYPFFFINTITSDNENHVYVPLAAYSEEDSQLTNDKKRKIPLINEIKNKRNVAYLFRHCTKNREELFSKLKLAIPKVDALGKCSSENPRYFSKAVSEIYKDYNFVISMENGYKPGYITEKIFNAFEAGAIPIYWGDDKTVNKYFNKDTFINVNNFKNFDEVVSHIKYLLDHPKKIQKMLSQPILTSEGEVIMNINRENLSKESREFLRGISCKLRKYYFKEINKKTFFEKLSGKS